MLIILSIICIIYIILHLFYFKGYLNSKNSKTLRTNELLKVSVIVAARNEELNIPECIDSLINLDYPAGLLEVILVNDNSEDNTRKVILEKIHNHSNFKLIELSKQTDSEGSLRGKAKAIHSGIVSSTGEIIFITDADCIVSSGWVKETLKYFSDDSISMVCGFTNIRNDDRIFSKLQSLDWIYLLSLAAGSAGVNKILSCIGNNISFRRKVYDETGGYPNIDFSITEDLALMKKINSLKDYRIKFPPDAGCLVRTNPCKTVYEFYLQKKRWFKGGAGISILGYLMAFELYMMNIILLLGLLFLEPLVYSVFVFIKVLSELFIFLPTYFTLRFRGLMRYYILFQIYFGIYGILLPLSFVFGFKIPWKGREY